MGVDGVVDAFLDDVFAVGVGVEVGVLTVTGGEGEGEGESWKLWIEVDLDNLEGG